MIDLKPLCFLLLLGVPLLACADRHDVVTEPQAPSPRVSRLEALPHPIALASVTAILGAPDADTIDLGKSADDSVRLLVFRLDAKTTVRVGAAIQYKQQGAPDNPPVRYIVVEDARGARDVYRTR